MLCLCGRSVVARHRFHRTVAPRALACPRGLATNLTPQAKSHLLEIIMKMKFTIATVAALFLGATLSFADSQALKALPKDYPLKKCPVSGDPLGEHGKLVKVSYQGTDVYLCCKDCVKDFKKDPAKYAKMVKDAEPKKK
jgi:YHS domain-containing protein